MNDKTTILQTTVQVLREGGSILHATDTIWGIACDATNAKAIASLYAIKQRDIGKNMLILVDAVEMLEQYVEKVPVIALSLIEKSRKPLTIIYPKAKNLPPEIVAADGSIGIRIVNDEFCKSVIKALGKPIVSTSANLSNHKSPLGFFDVDESIKKMVSYVVPVRLNEVSSYSSSDIVKIDETGNITIIR